MKIFSHARTSAVIDDAGGALAASDEAGLFDERCPMPPDNPAVVAALESSGRMPVAGNSLGLNAGHWVVAVVAAILLLIGVGVVGLGSGSTWIPGVIIAAVGLFLLVVAVASARQRRRNVAVLGKAWRQGWVRFAPARVGGVWIDRVSHHNEHRDRRNAERRFYYRALAEVHPTDGSEAFTFTTGEFDAAASWDGVPVGLNLADGPLDVLEPEFFNGWTICRYIAGQPHSATITTDLSPRQIAAALAAAGVR